MSNDRPVNNAGKRKRDVNHTRFDDRKRQKAAKHASSEASEKAMSKSAQRRLRKLEKLALKNGQSAPDKSNGVVAERSMSEDTAMKGDDEAMAERSDEDMLDKSSKDDMGEEISKGDMAEKSITISAQDVADKSITVSARDTADKSKPVQNPQPTRPTPSWSLNTPRGGRLPTRDPIFLRRADGDEFIVTSIGKYIKILDVQSSLVAASLPPALGEQVVSFDAVCTSEENLVRVLYSNGILYDWDWVAATTDESRPAADNIDLYRLSAISERIVSMSTTWNGHSSRILLDGIQIYKAKHRVLDMRLLHGVDFLVARCGGAILLGRKDSKEQYIWIELPWVDSTCIDARETKSKKAKDISLVIGQANGVLQLYKSVASLFATSELETPQQLHWHRRAVSAVKFSRDGNYLISGGLETTLVIWQLDTGEKSFLPNLTSIINRIVVNPSGNKYALQMGDNSIMVLSTSELKPVANFAGIQAADRPLAAVMHPSRKEHVLLSVASAIGGAMRPFLQTYDCAADKHVSRQALTRNNVTDLSTGPDKRPILPPDVTHLAMSSNGQWLATIDKWMPPHRDLAYLSTDELSQGKEESARREVFLKIWRWNSSTAEWMLNSRIDGPHDDGVRSGDVFKLLSDPTRAGFITIGEDSTIRIWRPQIVTRNGVAVEEDGLAQFKWLCKSTIALARTEDRSDLDLEGDLITNAALAVSDDGSLLAVSMLGDNVVHFVDIDACKVKSSHNNIAGGDLLDLAFIDRYLVALSRRALRMWDVVEDRLHLSKQIQESADAIMAVSRADNVVAVASPASKEAPPTIMIWQVKSVGLPCRIITEEQVTALLANPDSRGFTVIFKDASIRTLASGTALSTSQLSALTQTAHDEADSEQHHFARPLIEADGAMIAPSPQVEDDRSVVRPEELTKIFEAGNSATALPSIRDMFHAVAGLFGRKPRS